MTSTLGGEWRVRQKRDVIGRRECDVNECSGRPMFILFIKEN